MARERVKDETEQLLNIPFPLSGIEVSTAHTQQRPGTTPVALNMRALDQSRFRLRGASRPGLEKYIQEQLPQPFSNVSPREDTGNRANEDPLVTPSDGGSAWINAQNGLAVVSNQFVNLSAVGSSFSLLECSTPLGTARVTVVAQSTGNGGLVLRFEDLSNYYLFLNIAGSYALIRRLAGVNSTLVSGLGTPADGDVISAACSGSNLSLYNNGVLLTTVVDGTVSGTQFGMFLIGPGPLGHVLDNFGFTPVTVPIVVQHLNYVVDPTTAALLDNFDSDDGDEDPSSGARNPGRRIRGAFLTRRRTPRLITGRRHLPTLTPRVQMPKEKKKKPGKGSGRQPNRNKPGGSGMTFVQANSALIATPNASGALAYTSSVTIGDLLIVCVAVAQNGQAGAITVGVTDSVGTSYTQWADVEATATFNRLTCFYGKAPASGANTVTVTQSKNPAFAGVRIIALLEYSGQRMTAPLDSTSTNAPGLAHANPETTGSVTVSGTGEMLFGAFFQSSGNTLTPAAGYTQRLGTLAGSGIHCQDKLTGSTTEAVTATAITTILATANAGASFKTGSASRTQRQITEEKLATIEKSIKRLASKPSLTEDERAYLFALREAVGGVTRMLEQL